MGRFDALTQLNERPNENFGKEPKTAVPTNISQSAKSPLPQVDGEHTEIKPEIRKSGINEKSNLALVDKPQKYSTLLSAVFIRKIKLYSVENDMKDYEVIEKALTAFFDKRK